MLSKHDDSLSFIKIKNNKKHTASAKIINPKNLNRRTLSKFPRTSSAINLPGLHFDPNDSLSSFYSTGFTFKSKISKNNANNMNKTLSHLLNINSIEDFIGKDKENIEIQNQKQEEEQENLIIKETIINDNNDERILPNDENTNLNINNQNVITGQREVFDYLITIQYSKFLCIPYFIFRNIFYFYFPFKKFASNQIKLSEMPTPPLAVIRSECK